MATFQSQINILAAGQHQLHKKIEDITDFSLFVNYDSLNMEIKDNKDNNHILIQDLGSLAYNGILKVIDSKSICLMDNDGTYNCLTSSTDTDFGKLSTTQACKLTLTAEANSLFIEDKYSTSNSASFTYAPNLSTVEGLNVGSKIYKFIDKAYKNIRKEYINNAVQEGYGAEDNEDQVTAPPPGTGA